MSGHAAGSLTQLVAKGALDMYLTENPTSTFWRAAYARCTAFSMEAISQEVDSTVTGAAAKTVTLNRTGDLLYTQYLMVDLPGIKLNAAINDKPNTNWDLDEKPTTIASPPTTDAGLPTDVACDCADGETPAEAYLRVCREEESEIDSVPYVHWTNAVGMAMIDSATLLIGSQFVDSLWGEFLFAYEELSGRVGRRLLEMVGKRYTREELIVDSQESRTLYVPLPWWFTQFSGAALNLAALQFHTVQIRFDFRKTHELLVFNPRMKNKSLSMVEVCGRSMQLEPAAHLLSTYVYLDTDERSAFSAMTADQLIVQHQRMQFSASGRQSRQTVTFNHPIIELIWFARSAYAKETNNWFNFAGAFNRDPIDHVSLQLNAQERLGADNLKANYYRLVQPYQSHSCIPDTFVYCYSFALHPEDTTTPSGSANFSRIDNIEFTVTMQELAGVDKRDEAYEIQLYAINFNVGRLRSGLFGVAYSS